MTVIRLPLAERFWPKVKKTSTCWLWQGRIARDGYGRTRDESLRHIPAHRAAWILSHGPIPTGMCVCHQCDVRNCVRPSHLFLGTRYDNKLDEMNKRRHGFGERHPTARLTERDVKRIRKSRSDGAAIPDLAKHYGVTYQNIRSILIRKTWRHI